MLDEQLLDLVFHSPSRGTFWIYEARKALQGDFESPYGDGPNVERDEKLHGERGSASPFTCRANPTAREWPSSSPVWL